MKALRIFAILLLIPIVCFADYKVVVKKSGKVIEGKFVSEDDKTINLTSPDGIRISFKKELLDLDKMKELNASLQTQAPPPPPPAPKKTNTSGDSDLVALSKQLKAEHQGKDQHMANVKAGSGTTLDTTSGDQQQADNDNATQSAPAATKEQMEAAKDEATIQKGIADCQRWLDTYRQSIADYKAQGKDTTKLEQMMQRTQDQLDKLEADLDALHSGASQQQPEQ
jgi:hypothetical protein